MSHEIDAIFDHGVFRPLNPVTLPDGAIVRLAVADVPQAANGQTARIHSPRLAHPEQAIDFQLEVGNIADAGV
jgi:predicted DNA-binding antitoxin AbrB/MazE fold protein